jgi:hypothetical protein
MKSPFLSLNSKDFFKGLLVAVLSAVVTLLYTCIQSGDFIVDWKAIGMAALSAALAYITKNLLTNSNDELLKKEVSVSSSENPNT